MSYEFFVSLRYLKAKRKQTFISLITWISILGVAIGVTALITVLAVMTGAQEDMKRKILGANSHIMITHAGSVNFSDSDNVVTLAESVSGVLGAAPFVLSQVILTSATRVSGVVLRGIPAESESRSSDISKFITEGRLDLLGPQHVKIAEELDELGIPTRTRRAGIVIGRELAGLLRVSVGDPVTVVSPTGSITPAGMAPTSREFYVVGLFHSGMYEYDASLALIGIHEAQSLFKMGDKVTGVEVKVDDIYRAEEISEKIAGKIGMPLVTRDWKQLNSNLFFALKLEKTVLGLILMLIICVAAFNIVSTLIMVVMEKTRDIAILKAMGASSGSIMRIFLIEGLIIGCSGAFLGDIGGIALCYLLENYQFIQLPQDVYNLDTLPVQMELWDVGMVTVVALVVTTLATIYPAWAASKLDPAEALRYE